MYRWFPCSGCKSHTQILLKVDATRTDRDAPKTSVTQDGRKRMHSFLLCGKQVVFFVIYTLTYLILPWLVARTIYRATLHPLASVPGPRLGAVTSLWYAYHVRNGHMLTLAKTLHTIHGPAVRVRPDEVWFDSEEALRTIYSPVAGFEKSDFYCKPSPLNN